MLPKSKVSFYMAGNNVEINTITEELDLKPTTMRRKNEWPQASILAGFAMDTWELQTEKENIQFLSSIGAEIGFDEEVSFLK